METPLYLAALRGHVACLRLLLHGSGCGDEGGDGGSTIAGGSGGGGGDDGGGGGGGGGADLAAAVRPAAAFDGCLYHDGYTPLHAAVIGRSVECAALLLEASQLVERAARPLRGRRPMSPRANGSSLAAPTLPRAPPFLHASPRPQPQPR